MPIVIPIGDWVSEAPFRSQGDIKLTRALIRFSWTKDCYKNIYVSNSIECIILRRSKQYLSTLLWYSSRIKGKKKYGVSF